jgi:hypothetical protein
VSQRHIREGNTLQHTLHMMQNTAVHIAAHLRMMQDTAVHIAAHLHMMQHTAVHIAAHLHMMQEAPVRIAAHPAYDAGSSCSHGSTPCI